MRRARSPGLRIGLPREYFGDGIDPDVAAAIDAALAEFRALGATTVDIDAAEREARRCPSTT